MTRQMKRVRVIPSVEFLQRHRDFSAAIDAAAAPYIGKDRFPLSPFHAFDLTGADAEISRAFRATAQKLPHGTTKEATFSKDACGDVYVEVCWSEDQKKEGF